MRIRLTKKDGKFQFGIPSLKKALASLEDGDHALTIEDWKQSRSNLQNAFIHVCFDVYGNEMGYSPAAAKFLLKKELGVNQLIKNKRTGRQELMIRDTSDYTVEEMKVFIDRMLIHFEHDCGIIVDPKIRKQYRIDYATGELTEI